MKYVSWNCRGLGSRSKEEALKDIVRIYSPKILLIQETKMEDLPLLHSSKVFWKKGHGRAVSARGASDGIATFWNGTMYDFYSRKKQPPLAFHSAPPQGFWSASDLNVTLALDEQKGGSIVRDPAREWVEDIMLGWDLEDIKPSSGKFTWSNKRIALNHIAARLDRFLVHTSFLTCVLMATSKILPNLTSDHKPILLKLSLDIGPIPFRFSPLWIHQEGFQEVVSES
eukprot:PITA_18105